MVTKENLYVTKIRLNRQIKYAKSKIALDQALIENKELKLKLVEANEKLDKIGSLNRYKVGKHIVVLQHDIDAILNDPNLD